MNIVQSNYTKRLLHWNYLTLIKSVTRFYKELIFNLMPFQALLNAIFYLQFSKKKCMCKRLNWINLTTKLKNPMYHILLINVQYLYAI